jgi:tRNA-Thr(GGU) m(6)t(6)A37 methyltransferase TsaA
MFAKTAGVRARLYRASRVRPQARQCLPFHGLNQMRSVPCHLQRRPAIISSTIMQTIQIEPIGRVVSEIREQRDEHWGNITADIRLDESRFDASALEGLQEFSHVEVLFYFNRVAEDSVVMGTRHPRENPNWPKVGIFAQRGRKRPNRIGATICEIVGIEGRSVRVRGLDALDGSPVIDIKPVIAEFLPEKKTVRQPRWSRELMSTYF